MKKYSTHGKTSPVGSLAGLATCRYRIFFQNNFEVSIDLFGHVAVNAQRFNVKSFLQDRKKKHWYILTLPRLNNSTVSHSNFVLDSALEKALKK